MKKVLLIFSLLFLGLLLHSQQLSDRFNGQNGILSADSNCDYNAILSGIYDCNNELHDDSIIKSNLKERALLMSCVEWIPENDVPNNSGIYSKGKKVKGLPYSSVKELQKFIGLDVSIYTFLTAVNNPYSLLYSEDVAEGNPCYLGGTYNGKNSHTFYGTVCSSFTAFCYGENYNYASFNYRDGQVPNYYLKSDQGVEDLSSGDMFWCPGHVALITDVERDSLGHVSKIEMFESAGIKVYSKIYTPSTFMRRMSGNGNPKKQAYLYRNKLVENREGNSNCSFSKGTLQDLLKNLQVGNDEICTWFGDKPCIGEWDKVMINFKKKNFNKLIVSLNDEIVDTLDISSVEHSIEYQIKGEGIYKAQLASDSNISPHFTCFEVIDTSTEIINKEDGSVEIVFAEGSQPEFVFWVTKAGDQHTFPMAVPDRARKYGKMIIEPCTKKDARLRVIYRGKYGRAINRPDHLFPVQQHN